MPLFKRDTKAESVWREVWIETPHVGEVAKKKDGDGGEGQLVIKCPELSQKYGKDAVILDDGRTVGVAIGETVVFGIVDRGNNLPPLAMNVWRSPSAAKKRKVEAALGTEVQGGIERPTLPLTLTGELMGLIRFQSMKTGEYFVDCAEVFTEYGMDAKVKMLDMPSDIKIGGAVSFTLEPPIVPGAAPLCKNVARAAGEKAEAMLKQGFRKTSAREQWKTDKEDATMRMLGVVKRQSSTTGRHSVFCQDISDVYGHDAQIKQEDIPEGGLQVGDRIAFDVVEPKDSRQREIVPFAWNIRVVGGVGASAKVKKNISNTHGLMGDDGEEDNDEHVVLQEVDDEPEVEKGDKEEIRVHPEEAEEDVDVHDIGEATVEGGSEQMEADEEPEPSTKEEWAAAQTRLFAGFPKLKKGWIRIRSKSKGLVYYYNMETGESTATEPLA